MEIINKNILDLKNKIVNAENKYNRMNNSVILMAVSKTQSLENIKKAYESGQRDFGENYIKESIEKISQLLLGMPQHKFKKYKFGYKIIFKKFWTKWIKTRAIITEKSIIPTEVGIILFIKDKIGLVIW